jgi:hypothetical protein
MVVTLIGEHVAKYVMEEPNRELVQILLQAVGEQIALCLVQLHKIVIHNPVVQLLKLLKMLVQKQKWKQMVGA